MEYSVAFAETGRNVDIFQPVVLIKPENIHIGNHVIISEFAYINGGLGTYIGNHIHIAAHSCISGGGYFIMEDFSAIAAGAKIITGSAKFNGEGLTNPTLPLSFQNTYRSFVILKKHSIVATNAVVHPGVVIGEGTVVASGSIVTKNLEPWSIYMGAPAKKIKERNPENILKMEKELYQYQNLNPSNFSEIIKNITNNKYTTI